MFSMLRSPIQFVTIDNITSLYPFFNIQYITFSFGNGRGSVSLHISDEHLPGLASCFLAL